MQNYLQKHIHKIVIAALSAAILSAASLAVEWEDDYVHVDFLDVGQGDSILITTPENFQILVDGGPDSSVLESLRNVMPMADNSIDWLILTHPDTDHAAGLIDVLNNYEVAHVIMNDYPGTTALYKAWIKAVGREGADITKITDRQKMTLPSGIIFEFLHPSPGTAESTISANNASVVFRLEYKDISFLFTGDIESETETALVNQYGSDLEADVLKVPHHGSQSSSTSGFLDAVDPSLAVFQLGHNNDYGHPHAEVIYRYSSEDIRYWRTDYNSTVRLATDGRTIFRQKEAFWLFPQLFGTNSEIVYNSSDK